MNLESALALMCDVPDFPKTGITFKDMTPIFENPQAFRALQDALKKSVAPLKPTKILAIESRGFILGSPLALDLSCGLVLARKKGKLPRRTLRETYGLEYGHDELHLHEGAVSKADRVVIVDDVLATGGTLMAAANLARRSGAEIVGLQVVLELGFLGAREKLKGLNLQSLQIESA